MAVQQHLAEIERCLAMAKAENEKLIKGTKSAAPKLRSALLDIGKNVSEGRKLALDVGKAIPVKKRIPKEAKVEEELPAESPELERQDGVSEPEDSQPAEPTLAPIKKPRASRKLKLAPPAAVPEA